MKKLAIVLLIIWAPILWSQNYKFGKVSKAELEEKFYPLDSTANAAILYSERKVTFEYDKEKGFYILEKHFTRLKIYKPEGYEKATKKILVYHDQKGEEKVRSVSAKTYTLEKGKIVKTKLQKKNIFNEKESKYYNSKKFTMPNLQDGCIVEWKYEFTTPFIGMLDKVRLQENIPIKKIKVRVATPEYYIYNTKTSGFINIPIKKDLKIRTVSISSFERTRSIYETKSKSVNSSFEFDERIQLIEMSNIPAIKNEPFSGNINNYKAGINYELSSIKYPNKPFNNFATDWDAVVKKIYLNSSFGDQLKKQNHFKEELGILLKDKNSIEEKIIGIYQFVKSKIKWNNYNSIYSDEGVRKAYKKGVGNVADINLNLVAMLKFAGLEANPVLVSTINHGIPLFPTRNGFNYVIAKVSTPNGYVLLDATEKNALPNVLPERVLNFQGRVVSDDGTSDWVKLYPTKHAISKTVANVKFNEQGFKGTARKTITNNLLLDYREENREKSKETLLEWIDDHYKDIEIINARVSNLDKLDKDGIETIQFETESFVEEIANKTYISPMLYKQIKENDFKSEKREFPVFYNAPWASINEININIPENYTIESLPETIEYALPSEIGFFIYNINQNGQNIKVNSKLIINEPVIPVNYYNELREFYKNVIKKQAEKIVLVKK